MNPAILYAIASALLFGMSTPLAKLLTAHTGAVALAALLYLGAGGGLLLWRGVRGRGGAPLRRSDLPWLGGAIVAGGIVAPILLLLGLARLAGSSAALLLNLEPVFTAMIAWFLFREHFDRRILVGMVLIVLGGLALGGSGAGEAGALEGVAFVTAACLLWAVDNNLTRQVAAADPLQVAGWKGAVAGSTNLLLALLLGSAFPSPLGMAGAALVGALGYGLSLMLFVVALRELGAARTGAYFSLAPFAGAAASFLLLGESLSAGFAVGALLMAAGVWLHATERHAHEHRHEALHHDHLHVHDEHHKHHHEGQVTEPHSHPHDHAPLVHSHPHFPDLHHRHTHEKP